MVASWSFPYLPSGNSPVLKDFPHHSQLLPSSTTGRSIQRQISQFDKRPTISSLTMINLIIVGYILNLYIEVAY